MRLFGGCLVIVAVVAAIALMRLQNEPLSAPWIAEQAETRAQALLGPNASLNIAGSTAFWRGGTRFTVSLNGVSLTTANKISGDFKSIAVDLDLNPLADRLVALAEIRLIEPNVVLPWPPPLPKPRSPWPMPVGPLDGANRIIDSVVQDHGDRFFENLTIINGTVRRRARDDKEPQAWLNDIAGLATIGDAGNILSVVLTGRSARNRSFDIGIERTPSEADERGHTLALSVKGFDFPFSRRAAVNSEAKFGWVPVDLHAFGDFTKDYGIRDVTFAADLGPGTIPLGTRDSVFLKTGQVELAWQPDDTLFQISKAHVEFGDSVIDVSGTLKPDGTDPLNPWRFELAAQDAVINPSDVPGVPITLEQIIASGSIVPRERTLKVDRLSVLSPQAPIEGVGSVTFLPSGIQISGASNFGRIHAEVLKRLWPSFVAGGTRRWFLSNLVDGVVDRARIDISLGPEMTDGKPETSAGAEEAVDMEFDYSGVTMKSFGEMSNIYEGHGSAKMLGRVFELEIKEAQFQTPNGATTPASNGQFLISDVYSPERRGELSFDVEGDNDTVGLIADQKPIRALDRIGITSDALSGRVAAQVNATFPLTKKIAADDVQWRVNADFDKLTSSKQINGRSIKNANVKVEIDPTRLTMAGIATLDGVRANVQLTEPFGDPSLSMSGDLTLTLTDKERLARGIDLGDVLKGPVAVGIGVLPNGHQQIAVDLAKSVVNIPVFGWTKAKGIPGRATFLLRNDGKRLVLENFKMLASDAVIEGKIVINGNGQVQTANMSRFTVRKGDVATVKAKLIGKERYKIDFSAKRFDGRGLIKTLKSQQASADDEDFRKEDFVVSVKAQSLIGFNGESLRSVVSNMVLTKNRIETFSAKAKTGKAGNTEANGKIQDNSEIMTVTTSDAGSLLRFLNIYQSVERGDGFLQYSTDPSGRTKGHVTITDLTIQTTEEFSERLAETSKTLNRREDASIVPVPNKSGSKNSFEKFRAGFDMIGSNLKVTEAFVRSPLLGGSFAGKIDLLAQKLALKGTMIPAYGLNNLFGQIPVLGTLMGAGRHGGLVGVTFRIDGPIADPKLLINPASALAPGIFRKIFEFR